MESQSEFAFENIIFLNIERFRKSKFHLDV